MQSIKVAVFLFMLPLAGCGSSTAVEADKYQSLIVGKTTMAETIAALGQPDTRSYRNDDVVLGYSAMRVSPIAYVPIANMLAEETVRGQFCELTFSKAGTLKDKFCEEARAGH
ncbi:hypothetical protein [Zavarzinia compransoris]|uniref:Lipoprotein SmpA/OmlA domain-containing protein n=1 Tax=Zavarzinia compransoris TaxID=1264899 RepID=A0A317DUJ4_9PROT|nr:hypothetical protein [Zavarzinia compransoris]PWR18357.1 hypothetical protein DKG75_20555 [Zavarzinia compransoris]TDP43581.1 hypothetical protein DES42_1108 [Zavarzinia compransoris]